jgi:hypothetical protein
LDLGIEMGILGAGFDGIKDVYDMMHNGCIYSILHLLGIYIPKYYVPPTW